MKKTIKESDAMNLMAAIVPGGIEAQEKRGQTAFVESEWLPSEMQPNHEAYEKLGFKFGVRVDDIFIKAKLPPGWRKEPTDRDMWSLIVDNHGKKRVAIFYKAAFYDRHAFMRLESAASVKP